MPPTESQVAVQNIATYRNPITAMLNGRPVRIVATGDQPGKSPVLQYVDEAGQLNWESASRFRVIDSQFLPPSQEQLQEIGRAINQQGGSNR